MSPTRRDFLKYTGATSLLLASSDLVADLIAQSPKGNPLTSSFKGLADDSRSTALLSRYESRLHRIYQRSHQAFLDLRRAIAAGLLAQPLAPSSPQPPPPAPVAPAPTEDGEAPKVRKDVDIWRGRSPKTGARQRETASTLQQKSD